MQQHQCVHFKTQLHVAAGRAVVLQQAQVATGIGGHPAEPVDVRRHVRCAKPVFGQFNEKGIVTVLVPVIAVRLIVAPTPLRRHMLRMRVTAHRFMPAQRILDDRGENAAHIRIQAVTPGQLEGVLAFQRVGGVVALQQVLRVVEKHAEVGVARHIGQLHFCASAQAQ